MDIAVEPADVRLQHDGHTGHPGHTARSADESTDGLVVVRVSGDLDIHTSPQLRATLTGLLGPATTGTPSPASAGQRVRGVILDLREVPFMDSSALGVLVYGYKLTRPHRQGYAVVATSCTEPARW